MNETQSTYCFQCANRTSCPFRKRYNKIIVQLRAAFDTIVDPSVKNVNFVSPQCADFKLLNPDIKDYVASKTMIDAYSTKLIMDIITSDTEQMKENPFNKIVQKLIEDKEENGNDI